MLTHSDTNVPNSREPLCFFGFKIIDNGLLGKVFGLYCLLQSINVRYAKMKRNQLTQLLPPLIEPVGAAISDLYAMTVDSRGGER